MESDQQSPALLERAVLVSTILASSMAFIDSSALNVAMPAIQADLGASGPQILWIVNAYLLMLAALILIGGSLGDRLGRRRVFTWGIATFMLGSLACGLSPSTPFLIAARLLQGAGGALMIPGSLAIINAVLPPARRGEAIGTWSAATTLVTIIGPLLGGVLASAGLWRWVFLINLPLGVVALMVLRRVPETRGEEPAGPIDVAGAVLAALALAGLTYGFIAAPEDGFGSPLVGIPLAVGVVALLLFVWTETRARAPMMPLHLFRSGTFSGANLLTFFLYGALSAVSFFLSLNLVQAQGYTETMAGMAWLPFTVLLTVLSRWAGRQSGIHGPRRFLILGPAVVGFGFLLLALPGLTAGPRAYFTTFFPGIVLFGLGMGLTVAPLTTAVLAAAPDAYSGAASGINNAVARIAGVLTIAILGALTLTLFASRLMPAVDRLDLPAAALADLRSSVSELGNLQAPASLDASTAAAVDGAVDRAFSSTISVVLFISAVMAWLSALMAYVFIRPEELRTAAQEGSPQPEGK